MFKKIGNLYRGMNIRYKLLVSYVLITFIALTVFSSISNTYYINVNKKNIINNLRYSAKISNIYIEKNLDELINLISIASYGYDIGDLLSENRQRDIFEKYGNTINIQSYLAALSSVSGNNAEVFLYTENDSAVVFNNHEITDISMIRESSWYQHMIKNNIDFYCFFETETTDKQTVSKISVANFLKNPHNSHLNVGVVKACMDIEKIAVMTEHSNEYANSVTVIFGSENDLIYSSDKKLFNSENVHKLGLSKLFENPVSVIKTNGTKYFAVSDKISGANWDILYIAPYSDIYKSTKAMSFFLIGILFITLLFSYMVSYFSSKSLTFRLNILMSTMRNVKYGELSKIDTFEKTDEISQTIDAYNQMVQDIENLMESNMNYVAQVNQLSLDVLQSQINPHFLYNTLNLIQWYSKTDDTKSITELVGALSGFYKTSLHSTKSISTIREELEHIKYYIKIENFKCENAITLNVDIPDDIMDVNIPKITFQPIIENSIIHGIFEKDTPTGTISVTAKKHSDHFIISITDDGVGMTQNQIETVLLSQNDGNAKSIGLSNTNKRLTLYYGEKYGLFIESVKGVYTTVNIKIPYKEDI